MMREKMLVKINIHNNIKYLFLTKLFYDDTV